ncbi:MAG: site-specific DNA-methyltransferase [Chloroflexota bacterium]|nr:site-specific DNA-methyltransferase [Chloroflexota bacterium]
MVDATRSISSTDSVADYRYDHAKRKNNPPAGLAPQGRIAERPVERYAYNPHLPPVLRFDPTGAADHLPELLETARQRKLTDDEVQTLAAALRTHEPWLEWSGKREAKGFEVDPIALHIHERVSAKAILAVAARQDVQRSLFADPQQSYREAVQFYQHDVDWANRLILGDSLQVMASLAKREALAGQVQMIYMDPPYGIKYASNFQPRVGQRSVSDRSEDLARDTEVIKAYRDTWALGVHSYVAYLRDRFIACRDLLTDSGSLFLQIGDENVHLVRSLLDEIFGRHNFVSIIQFAKTSSASSDLLPAVADYILWYARDHDRLKYRPLFRMKVAGEEGATKYDAIEHHDGSRTILAASQRLAMTLPNSQSRVFALDQLTSQRPPGSDPFQFEGRTFTPSPGYWKTGLSGLQRLAQAGRITVSGNNVRYIRYLKDFEAFGLNNLWSDIGSVQSRTDPKAYVVQTATAVVQRCLLMSTDPGDLVLDPTCGSGTTAVVAEQWGRRWITTDTSRVALAIARQRILTATFDQYKLRDEAAGPSGGFYYKTVPHITLRSIAQNVALDSVFAKHAPLLAERLAALNAALAHVTPQTRTALATKLAAKERAEGKKAVTDADRRRWLLPKEKWEEWQVPFDTDSDWPQPLQDALVAYRAAWRAQDGRSQRRHRRQRRAGRTRRSTRNRQGGRPCLWPLHGRSRSSCGGTPRHRPLSHRRARRRPRHLREQRERGWG